MFLFAVYFSLFLYLIYRYSSVFYVNKWMSGLVFILKGLFVFLISYTSLKESHFLNAPDEDNYFHDALMFNALAREYPMYYCQFWLDIEPENKEVFNKYFTTTNAWYKAPEFLYNDNRWVVKVHSLLVFLSGGDLGVHRLFSVVFAMIGWMLYFKFVVELCYKMREGLGVFHSPSFIPPLYVKLDRANNSKKNYPHRPSLFQKRGDGGELREGCGGRRSRHCLAFFWQRHCEGEARSNLFRFNMKHFKLLHCVRNDDKARVAEAIAKPGTARPERSGTAMSEGHAQILKNKNLVGSLFLISSLVPSFFFFTSFVLKESMMVLLMGILVNVLYQWIINKNKSLIWLLVGFTGIIIAFFFRPAYLLPLIVTMSIFLWIIRTSHKYQKVVYLVYLMGVFVLLFGISKVVFDKSILDILQYRQERFLDASRGGIYLLNTRKFVRVPYDWNCLKYDSTQKIPLVTIKKNVPLMYWYLTNLKDTIIEKNKDTLEEYHILYSIEKANRTIYISPLNANKSFWYNIQSVMEALSVFFFQPKEIKGLMDVVVWIENVGILCLMIIVLVNVFKSPNLFHLWMFMFLMGIIVIVAVSSPNIGAIVRYRFLLLPILITNFV